jgi:hypothetical protein
MRCRIAGISGIKAAKTFSKQVVHAIELDRTEFKWATKIASSGALL